MHTWTWNQHNGQAYLTCSLLNDWQHGFFTQQWWPRLPSELVGAIAPETQVYRVKQVHGTRVLTVEEWQQHYATAPQAASSQDIPLPEADGMIAEHAADTVWVATADCVPVLIADAVSGRVAAVHAGWRGTAQKIVPITIQRFLEQGSQRQNLRVALGPAIAGEVYQVSITVAIQVGTTVLPDVSIEDTEDYAFDPTQEDAESHTPEKTALLEDLRSLERPPVLDDPHPGRARLDVRRINELQLEQLGLSPDQIAIAPYCTYQDSDRFFSYRRSRQKKVQWSGISASV